MDSDEIKVKAFFLSQKGLDYKTLIQMLVKLDYKFEYQQFIDFGKSSILINQDLFQQEHGDSFTKGRFELLRTMHYMNECHYPIETLHWLIAEREYIEESITNKRNILNENEK